MHTHNEHDGHRLASTHARMFQLASTLGERSDGSLACGDGPADGAVGKVAAVYFEAATA